MINEGANQLSLSVEIPVDDDGFFGRQCPSCKHVFRIHHEDYEALPDDLRLWCVYCGNEDDHGEFLTLQQEERILSPAGDIAMQMMGQALDDSFGSTSRRSSGSMVTFSYRSQPFFPKPLPGIDEERLIRERVRGVCSIRYAVFGEHRFCPLCGPLPAAAVALDALGAERTRLDVLDSLPADSLAHLREQGVLDRINVDTIENLVSIVETLAHATFRAQVPDSDTVLKVKGKIFQRLADTAGEFKTRLGIDLRSSVGDSTWNVLEAAWAARHVFTHRDGIVDERYIAQVPNGVANLGQRLVLPDRGVQDAIDATTALCNAIAPPVDSPETQP
jgi:ribosomal protein S27AE